MVIKITAERMVATSGDGCQVHNKMSTLSKDMVQHVLEDKDIQTHSVYVQNVQSNSGDERYDKEDNHEKYEAVRETGQKCVDNNLMEKLTDLKITDTVEKSESPSLTEELETKNKSRVSEERKEIDSGIEKTMQSVICKTENFQYKDEKDVNKNNEEVPQKYNHKQTKLNMNIPVPLDEIVDDFDNLKVTIKTQEDEDKLISRGPERGHQNIYNCRVDPYSRFVNTSHNLHTGGCIIAQVSPEQTYNVQPQILRQPQGIPIERAVSPLLTPEHYLSDEAEEQIILDFVISAERDIAQTQHQPIKEQQVPHAIAHNKDLILNDEFPPWETFQFESDNNRSNFTNSNVKYQCLSPESTEDPTELYMFSPSPHYRQCDAHSLSTGTPSPLSSSTDTSCYSPISLNSIDSTEEVLQTFNVCVSSLPSTSCDIQLNFTTPANNLAEIVNCPDKSMTSKARNIHSQKSLIEKKREININNEIIHSGNSFNLQLIDKEPEVPRVERRSALERMNLDREKKRKAFHHLAMFSDEKLSVPDNDGDTKLLIMVAQKLPTGFEYLYAIVKRLKTIQGALAARNFQGHSALLLSCMYMRDKPLVARFIAESLQSIGHDLNEVYDNGNTIIHELCERGDEYLNILVELLSMKDETGLPCFDINRHNHSTGTPLLVAVKAHGQNNNCSGIIAFLLSQGANVTDTERCGGRTSLHIAIKESGDPLIVQILLKAADRQGKNLVNCMDYPKDTALHYAHLRNDIPIQRQLRIISLLLQYGATNITGSQGRMPLALVMPAERKEVIRANTQRRNRKQ